MKFEVYSLPNILKNLNEGDRLISIRDSICESQTAERHRILDERIASLNVDALRLVFDDVDPYRFHLRLEHPFIEEKFHDGIHKPVFFNSELAGEVLAWCKRIHDEDPGGVVKVHCWAGMSRSQAVAYWLNTYFNLVLERNMDDYIVNNMRNVGDKVHFNCEVLKIFTQTFG